MPLIAYKSKIAIVWPSWLRCREWVWPDAKDWGDEFRCYRSRWHRSTHLDDHGDAWEGKR
jgi:hypothetical protein